MRAKHTALILTAGFLLIPTLTWSQGPGGRPDRGFGGGPGGFGKGQWGGDRGGAPWGGQPSAAPGGGDAGGKPTMRMDPDTLFDTMAKGQQVIRVDQLEGFQKSMFDRFASRFGLSGNEITRDQFKTAMNKVREAAASGQLGPNSFRGGAPGAGGAGGMDPDRRVEEIFKRMDKNENGVLEFNEMSQTLQDERDKYDTNHDGVIDLNEFKAYVAARRGDRSQDPNDPTANRRRPRPQDDPGAEPEQAERKRPQVVRAGNMPKDFPFAELDRDGDGQIGLYEWKDAGRPIAQFLEMDLNNDGFLTVDEYYHWKRKGDEIAAKSGTQSGQVGRGMGRGIGMNPGVMAFGGGGMMGRGGANQWGGGGGGNPWAGGGGFGMGGGGFGGGRGGFGGGGPGAMSFRMGGDTGGGGRGGFGGGRGGFGGGGPGGQFTFTPSGSGGGGMTFRMGGDTSGGGFRGQGGPGNGFGGAAGQDTGGGFGGRGRGPGGFGAPGTGANADDRNADRGPGGRGGRRGFGGDNADGGRGGRRGGFGNDNGGDQGPAGFGGRRSGGRGRSRSN